MHACVGDFAYAGYVACFLVPIMMLEKYDSADAIRIDSIDIMQQVFEEEKKRRNSKNYTVIILKRCCFFFGFFFVSLHFVIYFINLVNIIDFFFSSLDCLKMLGVFSGDYIYNRRSIDCPCSC